MKDILNKIDDIDEKINLNEIKKKTKNIMEKEEKIKLETDFKLRFEKCKESSIVKDELLGKFRNHEDNTQSRIDNMILMIDTMYRMSQKGEIEKGHELYMTEKYKRELIKTAKGLYKELGEVNLKNTVDENYRSNEAQSFLNERSLGKRGEILAEGTCKNIRLRLQKLNLIETIGTGKFVDYSSNIKTTYELNEERNKYRSESGKGKVNDNKNKQFNYDDYNRAKDRIVDKLRENPQKVTDPEVAFVLAGEYLFRKDTIQQLFVEQCDVSTASIEVYDIQNKSTQPFVATTSYIAPESADAKETLSLIVQRAKLRNFNKRDANGFIPVITCSEQFLYKGYNKILKDNNITKSWEGSYHALRHMGAQRRYDEIRRAIEEQNEAIAGDKTKADMISESLKELNYALGHTKDHVDTTMGYVKNIW